MQLAERRKRWGLEVVGALATFHTEDCAKNAINQKCEHMILNRVPVLTLDWVLLLEWFSNTKPATTVITV